MVLPALAAALSALSATAAPASTVVVGSCDEVTDGDTAGCLFKGNINGNDNGNKNSFKTAEAAYNAWANSFTPDKPNITLNFLTSTDPADAFSGYGFYTGANSTGGIFNLDGAEVPTGFKLEYFAVKSSTNFVLYEYLGSGLTGSWTTAGLTNKKGTLQGLSHLVFFGSAGAVPEPTTWATMIVGFGVVGATMRSARRKSRRSRPGLA